MEMQGFGPDSGWQPDYATRKGSRTAACGGHIHRKVNGCDMTEKFEAHLNAVRKPTACFFASRALEM